MKKIVKALIIVSLFVFGLFCYLQGTSVAGWDSYGNQKALTTEDDWATIKALPFVGNKEFKGGHGTSNANSTVNGYSNNYCFHTFAYETETGDNENKLRLKTMLDIDTNGIITLYIANDANVNDTTYRTVVLGDEEEEAEYLKAGKALAYYSAMVSCENRTRPSEAWDNPYRNDFFRIWFVYNFNTLLQSNGLPAFDPPGIDFSAWETGDSNFDVPEDWPEILQQKYKGKKNYDNIGPNAMAYGEGLLGLDTFYVARIFVFYSYAGSSSLQDRVMLFGNEITPTAAVNKYITKVDPLDPSSGIRSANLQGSDDTKRSSKEENEKSENPVKVPGGVKVTYKMTVTNLTKNKVTGTISDVFDEEFFSNLDILSRKRTIALKSNKTITITLENGTTVDIKTGDISKDAKLQVIPAGKSTIKLSQGGSTTLDSGAKITHKSSGKYVVIEEEKSDTINITLDKTIDLFRKETDTYVVTLDGNADVVSGKYANTLRFEIPVEGDTTFALESSDYVDVYGFEPPIINKYISSATNVKSKNDTKTYHRSKKTEEEKATTPANIGVNYREKTITYIVSITNPNDYAIEGAITDTADKGVTVESITYDAKTIKNGSKITVPASTTVNVTVVATFPDNGTAKTYGNKAEFKGSYELNDFDVVSREYFNVKQFVSPTIKKHISVINTETFSRSNLSEEGKFANPAYAGYNDETKNITYTVSITNPNECDIEGVIEDEADDEITIESIIYDSNSIEDGDAIEIPTKETKDVTINASFPEGGEEGVYENLATFEVSIYTLESRDYFEVEESIISASIKKYISSVSGSAGSFKPDRNEMDAITKYEYPAEVEKGSLVTYTVEITNNIHYQNRSSTLDCSGEVCTEYVDKHDSDLFCIDTYDKNFLKYVTCEGENATSVSFDENTGKISWFGVEEDTTAKIYLTFEVIASNMKLMNIENKVDQITYQYTLYGCVPVHGEYYWVVDVEAVEEEGHTEEDGTYVVDVEAQPEVGHWECDHTTCYFDHPETVCSGEIEEGEDIEDVDYIRLLDPEVGGVVFLDKDRNDLKTDDGENISGMAREEYKNVIVELWREGLEEGEEDDLVDTKVVDSSTGAFSFGRVRKGPDRTITEGTVNDYVNIGTGNSFYYTTEELYHYYIKYYYDGERFETVIDNGTNNLNEDYSMKPDFPKDSNASEIDRTPFNAKFETIAYNKSFAKPSGNGTEYTLAYQVENTIGEEISNVQKSKVYWDGTKGSVLTMGTRTFTFFFENGETEYLKYMNLGIFERKQADLSLQKDVVNAEVSINGHRSIYQYEKLGTSPYVATPNNVLDKPYVLKIYKEDYEFRTDLYDTEIGTIQNRNNEYQYFGNDNDLQIILTYKITITNNSTDEVDAVVREIVDYSSKEMRLLPETVKLNDTALVVNQNSESSNSAYGNPTNTMILDRNYITGTALNNTTLGKGESLEVYVSYKVLKDTEQYILNDSEDDEIWQGKVNIAEIGAYSFYDGGKVAGLVDFNSNPANLEVDSEKAIVGKFEDDTFETGINVVVRNDPKMYRTISGIVFEEKDKEVTETSDGQLVGNGKKDGNDIPAPNVIARLYEVVRETKEDGTEEEYLVDTGLWFRTGTDGKYRFGENLDASTVTKTANYNSVNAEYRLHVGKYIVRFVYGDEAEVLTTTDGNTIKYSGQDYQSVKYEEVGNAAAEDEILRANAFAQKSGNTNPFTEEYRYALGENIYSVAKDNEIRRLEVNEYSTTMTYPMDTVLKAGQGSDEMQLLASHTAMFADTKVFDIKLEYDDFYLDSENNIIDGVVASEQDFYSVRDVNFGLIERPKTKLQLMNDIEEITAITADGNKLIDIFFDINYEREANGNIKHTPVLNTEKSIGTSQVQILNRSGANQGFRYANIDTDLLQGMTIVVKFKVAVANNGEVDHIATWLENKIESEPYVDLSIEEGTGPEGTSTVIDNGSQMTDVINGDKRNYSYTNNYLYKLLYNGDTSKGIGALRDASYSGSYAYDSATVVGSAGVRKSYTYRNIVNKVQSDYHTGYYLGDIYYGNVASGNEAKVKTRVDQYIDYVDNDLIFKPEENVNEQSQITHMTYEAKEIAEKGLLKGVRSDTTVITDGEKDYYNSTVTNKNNNLAFSIENEEVNSNFYKYVSPMPSDLTTGMDQYLYTINIQGARTLTSEVDLEGILVDNIAEIVKVSNTAGRKVYVKVSENSTGLIGNTVPEVSTMKQKGTTKSIVDIARAEADTDFSEYVTFSPPTGLTEKESIVQTVIEKTTNGMLIVIPVMVIVIGASYIIYKVATKKKFYK